MTSQLDLGHVNPCGKASEGARLDLLQLSAKCCICGNPKLNLHASFLGFKNLLEPLILLQTLPYHQKLLKPKGSKRFDLRDNAAEDRVADPTEFILHHCLGLQAAKQEPKR